MEIRQLAGALGAEVIGLDLTREIEGSAFSAVRDALHKSGVICIRDQGAMTPEDQLAFAGNWGEISIHPYVPSIEGYPGIMKIYDPNPITQTWHSDSTHMRHPHAYTLLLARVLPKVGGDTMFASAVKAFESLSPGLQEALRALSAVHEGTSLAAEAGLEHEAVVAVHPMVRAHPDTGAEALFVKRQLCDPDRWVDSRGEPPASGVPLRSNRPLREHLPTSLAPRRPGDMGQPIYPTRRRGRCQRRRASAQPGDDCQQVLLTCELGSQPGQAL